MKFKLNLTALETRENPSVYDAAAITITQIVAAMAVAPPLLTNSLTGDGGAVLANPPLLGPAMPSPFVPVTGIPLGVIGF